ncbi:MAG TPA: ABC transporter ATP-binding protein [Lentisphaeria bacterium]|nr:ABC transporter ATP-binding protein [Lentisphaeria bacterium]
MSAALVLRDVTKQFRNAEHAAVANVSLEVSVGEVITILGESGGGKSTLLRLIGGFELPDLGEILLNGETLNSPQMFCAPESRGISMVFQGHSLFPHMTVRDNIAYGLHRMKSSARDQEIERMLTLTELSGLQQRYPHELSGGQQQRVAIARSLAPKPSVMLLDEPFSSLDRTLATQIRNDLADLMRRSGATTLWVTHTTEDAMAISDRIAVMHQGRLVQLGTPESVFCRPQTRYVAELLGPANLLRVQQQDGQRFCPALAAMVETELPTPTHAVVRPDDIVCELRKDGPATVRRTAFQGTFMELTVDSASEQVRVHYRGPERFAVGDSVALSAPAQRVWVISDPG